MRDSCGSGEPRETPQVHSAEEAPGSPAESECLQRKLTPRQTGFNIYHKAESKAFLTDLQRREDHA